MRADMLVRLPSSLSDVKGAALMLKGMTASFLLHDVYAVKPGDHILVHAAAGGVGQIRAAGPRPSAPESSAYVDRGEGEGRPPGRLRRGASRGTS